MNKISSMRQPQPSRTTPRANEIRASYSCRRTADGIYSALAEELTQTGPTELLTFDGDLPRQAARNAPTVKVRLLV